MESGSSGNIPGRSSQTMVCACQQSPVVTSKMILKEETPDERAV